MFIEYILESQIQPVDMNCALNCTEFIKLLEAELTI